MCQSKGEWHDWLLYFLNEVAAQASAILSRAERINALIMNWHIQVGQSEGIAHLVVKYLAVNPYLTATKVSETLSVAFTTAQRAIGKLEKLKIISQVSKGKRDRVYCATEILRILEEPTKISEDLGA